MSRKRRRARRRVSPSQSADIPGRQQKLLSAGSSVARTRDLPSAHAPLRDGPPISLFHGFHGRTEDDVREDKPIPERVAARFISAGKVIHFQVNAPSITPSDVRGLLRAHGIEADAVHLEPGSWPGQANFVGMRDGVPALHGTVAIDLRVEGESATMHAEIRIHPREW